VIVHRYLFREVLQVFAAVLAVLLLIYVSNRFVRYLAQAASGYISSDLVLELMLLKLAENLALLLPLALYLAVLLALGRLYRDSEVIAMTAAGIGLARLTGALAGFATGFALICALLSTYLAPKAAELQHALFEQAKGKAKVAGLQPGRFQELGGGDQVVYVEEIADDGSSMANVFVQVSRERGQDLLVAERAYPSVEGAQGERFMVLENGHRYTGAPGDLDFVITRFERHAVRVQETAAPGYRKLEATPTLELLREGDARHLAELQWRLSLPLSTLLLTVMAVPLARTSPRQGRYAKLVTAFVLYFLYNNALGITQKLVEREELHPWVGVWPVHGAFLAGALILLLHQSSTRRLSLRPPWRRRAAT
jgi:lipopolysaccharide export system permease protein